MEVRDMIESVNVFPNKALAPDLEIEPQEIEEEICETVIEDPEKDKKSKENKESEKSENIMDTVRVTFKSLVSLLCFIFLCVILAATLSDNVTNVIAKNSAFTRSFMLISHRIF